MKNLKKFFVLFLCLSFVFGTDSLTFAAKKKLRSASAKKGASKRSGSAKSKRSGSSKSKRSGSARSKRFAGGTASRSSNVVSSAGGSANNPTLSKTTEECRSAYVDCLDTQIKGYLAKYSYLSEDAAIEALQETGDPIRCAYFDKDFDGDNSKSNKNINELYFSYNYFCDNVATVTGESGQPIYECSANNTTNAFATKNSTAYYKETLRRLDTNELVVLNFTKTALGKKIQDSQTISTVSLDDVNDMFKELGLGEGKNDGKTEKTVEMFSISVAPPISAGSLNPKGLFQKAHNVCMKLDRLDEKGIGLGAEDLNNLKSYIAKLSQSNCRNDYESSDLKENRYAKYYQNGEWKTCPNGYRYNSDAETCEAKSGVTTEDGGAATPQTYNTSFLSAKASCDSYQQSLISARTQLYAKFKDRMTNYLNENLAQLIKKEASNRSALASAQSDMDRIAAETKAEKLKNEMEIAKITADAEAQKAEADRKAAEVKAQTDKIKEENAMLSKIQNSSWDDNNKEEVSLSGSGTLGIGLYKVIVAGSKGGSSAQTGGVLCWGPNVAGGNGDVKEQVFRITSGEKNYSMTKGNVPGTPARKIGKRGENGGNGPNSTFVIDGVVNITAEGGKGGISSSGCSGGTTGAGAGSAKNSGNGYVRLYKATFGSNTASQSTADAK